MKIAITDANIFIDLHYLEKLDLFFKLDIEVHTTSEVLLELEVLQVESLLEKKALKMLHVQQLEDSDYNEEVVSDLPKGLSKTDQSVCVYCLKSKSMVLTGDALLRKTLIKNEVEVHGILWIFDQWVEQELLSPKEASKALNELIDYNTWLPNKECVDRIEKWLN